MGILSVLTSSTFSIQADGESSTLMKVVETVRDNVWGIPLIVLIYFLQFVQEDCSLGV